LVEESDHNGVDMSFGGSASYTQGQQSDRVQVPAWLQPFFDQGFGLAGDAKDTISSLGNQDNVADLNPDQLAALEGMRNFAGGAGGFIPTAQNTFLDAAQGVGTGFLDPGLQQRLSGEGFSLSDYIGEGRDAVNFTRTPEAREALMGTARGDYLFGGEGFDAAVDAAVRAAQPHIMSAFGGDAASVNSGLSQHAIGQSAVDAFASQYKGERANQLGAAESLESGGRADRSQYLGFGEAGANRARRGDELLANMTDAERRRQLGAAGALPDIGLLDQMTRMNIGDILQGQSQRELDRPMEDQLRVLTAMLQGIPNPASFFGNDSDFSQFGVKTSAGIGPGFGG
jgi:hypothetical protein